MLLFLGGTYLYLIVAHIGKTKRGLSVNAIVLGGTYLYLIVAHIGKAKRGLSVNAIVLSWYIPVFDSGTYR